uniref:Ig-like domain-containing protein n=1 Tax=Sarcophilus harrisii TaxID=9305 RepID=A0A7N4NQW5_SARHA
MAWPLVCLLLLTCCSGSFSQPVLTQAPSMSASLGATARLTCTLSSEYSDYGITWQQQSPGKAPRYLMLVYSDGSAGKGEGVPNRFSGSASGANSYLSISNIQAEDEADYYCGAGYGRGGNYGSHGATSSEEMGQKPPCQPSPPPPAAPTSGPAPATKGPEVVLPVSLSQAQSPMSRTCPRAH